MEPEVSPGRSTRLIVAMSGGVDSSVAAALLQEQGYELLGMTLQLWGKDVCTSAGTRLCCSVRDALDAKAVARRLGFPHETVDLAEAFQHRVIDYFVGAYRDGLTPNPCVACNDHIKFGELLAVAQRRGASGVATGHYARLAWEPDRGRFVVRRARDAAKDQSYVLFGLTQEQLSHVRWPLGELDKTSVRAIATRLGLATAEKPDSQDVCFVRDGRTSGFLRDRLAGVAQPGPIRDVSGRQLGTHQGLLGYTIGQREGLGLALGRPLYVVDIDPQTNVLTVGNRAALLRDTLVAERVNWVSVRPPAEPIRARVQIRSRHPAAPATLTPQDGGRVRVGFDEPQAAVTPGQAAVFYDDEEVLLGGGWITKDAED